MSSITQVMPAISKKFIDVIGLPDEAANFVTAQDSIGDLTLYHYITMDVSKEEEFEYAMGLAGDCRGVIVDSVTSEIVCRSFPYTRDYYMDDKANLSEEDLNLKIDPADVVYSPEGVVIRVYFHNDKWHKSTHHKIDAYSSHWGSKISFGEMFDDAAAESGLNLDSLDKNLCWIFMVLHPENRLVIKVDKPSLTLLAIWNRTTQKLDTRPPQITGANLCRPFERSASYVSMRDLFTIVGYNDNNKYIDCLQAIGLFIWPQNKARPFKIISPEWKVLANIRGKCQNIKERYLELLKNPHMNIQLAQMYPEHAVTFGNLELGMKLLTKKIYNLYFDKYINKKDIGEIPTQEWVTLKKLHYWYLENPAYNRMSMATVLWHLHNTKPRYILMMLDRL